MADIETLKWLWNQTYTSEQKEQLLTRVAATADGEALKWFWSQTYTSEQKAKLLEGVAARADGETLKWFWSQTYTSEQKNTLLASLTDERRSLANGQTQPAAKVVMRTSMDRDERYDIFISHASEDKDAFVRLLAHELTRNGIKVWYDEFTLSLGDSLRRSIDRGLARSRFGVVVLSRSFFAKEWPQKELDGLVAREDGTQKVILPVWHNVTKAEVAQHSPMLADRIAVSSHGGVARVVKEILQVLRK